MKKIKYYTLGLITGLLIFSTIGVFAVSQVLSNEVLYDNSNSNLNSNNVKDAIDELFQACTIKRSLASKIEAGTSGTHGGYAYSIVNEGNGIRYEGRDPQNYICFSSSCTDAEKYRIIGTFNEMIDTNNDGVADTNKSVIKIIKSKALTSGNYWNTGGTNNWADATLKTYLNSTYYNSLSFNNKIVTTRWWTKGHSSNSATAANFLNYERNGTKYSSSYADYVDAKVGLMYASDYGYAVLSTNCARSVTLNSYNSTSCCQNDWLYYGSESVTNWSNYTWMITPLSFSSHSVCFIDTTGYVYYNGVSGNVASGYQFSIRPSFYLDAQHTFITSGTGSSSDPYIIN